MNIRHSFRLFQNRVGGFKRKISTASYWRRAFFLLLFIFILFIVAIVTIFFRYGLKRTAALMLATILTTLYLQRNRFLSPFSIRLQTTLFNLDHEINRVKKRGLTTFSREISERRPLITAFATVLVVCLGIFISIEAVHESTLKNHNVSQNITRTLWIVHATATGFSFIVLIFFWEYLGDEYDSSVLIRTAVRYTWSLHVIYFLLVSNIVIGVLAVLSQNNFQIHYVGIQLILFLVSIFGIYWLYRTIYQVMVRDTLTLRVQRRLQDQVRGILTESSQDPWRAVVDSQISGEYPVIALPSFDNQKRFTADDLDSSGNVTDIHLRRIHDLMKRAAEFDVSIEKLPALNQRYSEDDHLLVIQGDLTDEEGEELKEMLQRSMKVSQNG